MLKRPKELKLENLPSSVVEYIGKLEESYAELMTDNTKYLYSQVNGTLRLFGDDLKKLNGGDDTGLSVIGSDKDDKLFERLVLLIKTVPDLLTKTKKLRNEILEIETDADDDNDLSVESFIKKKL